MGQQDCLDYLMEQVRKNPEKWHRIKDVQEGLRKRGLGNGSIKMVGSHLLKLTNCGDIAMRGVGVWKHYKEFKAFE